jgi:hypothetical protein
LFQHHRPEWANVGIAMAFLKLLAFFLAGETFQYNVLPMVATFKFRVKMLGSASLCLRLCSPSLSSLHRCRNRLRIRNHREYWIAQRESRANAAGLASRSPLCYRNSNFTCQWTLGFVLAHFHESNSALRGLQRAARWAGVRCLTAASAWSAYGSILTVVV